MKKFILLDGLVAPLDRANVDTDAIIPKQFLKSIKRSAFGPNLFDEWRYLDHGEPGMDNARRPLNADFVLNQARYKGAQVLLARKNFGCGSSREQAAAAVKYARVGAVIAVSFARIFFRNSINLGLPVVISQQISSLEAGDELEIDLASGEIRNLIKKAVVKAAPLDPRAIELLQAGGLIPYLRKRYAA